MSPHPVIMQLVSLDTLKTWSLIVTLFGDLNGKQLSGRQIRLLLGYIGIKPEAIRVALHRLKSDGWILATKQGREAIYEMSPMALAQTHTVAPDIYCQTPKYNDRWCFELFEVAPLSKDAILLNKNLAVTPVTGRVLENDSLMLVSKSADLPLWIEEALVSENLLQLAGYLETIVPRYTELSDAQDQTVFRLLILHLP